MYKIFVTFNFRNGHASNQKLVSRQRNSEYLTTARRTGRRWLKPQRIGRYPWTTAPTKRRTLMVRGTSSPSPVVVFIFYMVKSFGFFNYIIVVLGERWGRWSMPHDTYTTYICRYSHRKSLLVYPVRREIINDILQSALFIMHIGFYYAFIS